MKVNTNFGLYNQKLQQITKHELKRYDSAVKIKFALLYVLSYKSKAKFKTK